MTLPKYLIETLYYIFKNKLKPIDYNVINKINVPIYWNNKNIGIRVPYLLFKRTKDENKQLVKHGIDTQKVSNVGIRYYANYKLAVAIQFYGVNIKDYFRMLYASRFDKFIASM